MTHETDRLSALVDGELDHDARDRLLAHLTRCDRCRAVVEEERAVKAMLRGLPDLVSPPALGSALVGLGAGSDPVRAGHRTVSRTAHRTASRTAHRRRVRYGMVGGLSAVGAMFAVALTSGGVPARHEPGVTPPPQPAAGSVEAPGSRPGPVGVSFEQVGLMPPAQVLLPAAALGLPSR